MRGIVGKLLESTLTIKRHPENVAISLTINISKLQMRSEKSNIVLKARHLRRAVHKNWRDIAGEVYSRRNWRDIAGKFIELIKC